MNYTIDATNKSLGRVATEAASVLMGKNSPNFSRNTLSGAKVDIINASKLKIAAPKMTEKTYKSFSGYPGGLKETSLAHMIEKKGHKEIVAIAVKGMLPSNRLRTSMMKNLSVTD